MVAVILQVGASEGRSEFNTRNSLELIITAVRNIRITGSVPLSITPPFVSTILKISEPDWYTFGALVFVDIPSPEQPILDIELKENNVLEAGILIRVNTIDSLLRSHWLNFPAGSLHRTGCRIRVNLSRIVNQLFCIEHRMRSQQLLIETEIKIQEFRQEARSARSNALQSTPRRPDTPIPFGLVTSTSNERDSIAENPDN